VSGLSSGLHHRSARYEVVTTSYTLSATIAS